MQHLFETNINETLQDFIKWQVKVFYQCLDVQDQNIFFDTITLNFKEKKAGTKWYNICTTRISIFRIPPDDPCVFIYFHAKKSIF